MPIRPVRRQNSLLSASIATPPAIPVAAPHDDRAAKSPYPGRFPWAWRSALPRLAEISQRSAPAQRGIPRPVSATEIHASSTDVTVQQRCVRAAVDLTAFVI